MSEVMGPRYQQVADALRRSIEAGNYPVGSFLPPEIDLCAAFNVSRHTAREALRRLSEAGLIQRRQGSGSQVVADRAPAAYVHAMRSLNELFQYAADTDFRTGLAVLARPALEFAEDLDGSGEEWLATSGLRTGGGRPICFSHVFINRRFAEIGPDLAGLKGAIYAHLEDRFGVEVAEVEQSIRVVGLPPDAASALHERRLAPAARVRRRYRDGAGTLLIASVNYHPAEGFDYAMRLRREEPRGGWG